jgi:amidase
VVTKTVRDMATALTVMSGADAGAPYAAPTLHPLKAKLRIGILTATAEDVLIDDDALKAVASAAKRLESLGHVVEPAKPCLSTEDWLIPGRVYLTQVCAQAAADFAGKPIPEAIEAINRAAILRGRAMSAERYLAVMRSGHDFARRFAAIWESHDVVLTPALASTAPKLGQFPTDHQDVALHVDRMTRFAPFASPFNLTGGPALVIPTMTNSVGLPVAVQLAADQGHDRQLLALGDQLQRALSFPTAPG